MQGCKLVSCSVVFAALVHSSVLSSVQEYAKGGDNVINTMMYVGSVDGKSFFVESTPRRTWQEARQACSDSRMHQASITSENQSKLLTEIYNLTNATSWYWTAGRDSQHITQFLWEPENLRASSPGVNFRVDSDIQTCLLYESRLDKGILAAQLCKFAHGTLCEICHSA